MKINPKNLFGSEQEFQLPQSPTSPMQDAHLQRRITKATENLGSTDPSPRKTTQKRLLASIENSSEVEDLEEKKQKIPQINEGEFKIPSRSRSVSPKPIPSPTLASIWESPIAELDKTPQTPRKGRVASRNGIVQTYPFQVLHEALESNEFKYKVSKLPEGEGTYFRVYEFQENEIPIIPEIKNSDLVLKALHGIKTKFIATQDLDIILANILQNYQAIKMLGLNVAPIFNSPARDRFIIQKKIPDPIDPLNLAHLAQVAQFFKASVENGLMMDLLPQNFRVANGIVYLIDFVENPEENTVELFNEVAIKEWAVLFKIAGLSQEDAINMLYQLIGQSYSKMWIANLLNSASAS